MEEHKLHVKNELNLSLQGRDTMAGRIQYISCSLEDKGKVVLSIQCMVSSPFEKTGVDEHPQTGKLNLKYLITGIILVCNTVSLSFMY